MAVFITPTEVTPGSASAWTDVDVSAYIPSGATGVMLHIVNTHATADHAVGWRKNGSTDNRIPYLSRLKHVYAAIGVDGSRIFEAYVANTTDIDIYIVGYFTTDAVFFTNAVNKSLSATTTWTDIDIASDTGGDTAIGALFEIIGHSGVRYDVGLRKNGSTDARVNELLSHNIGGWAIGVDGSEICEGYIENVAVDFFLVGYIKSDAVFLDNATDLSTATTGSYVDLPALPSGAIGGFIEVAGTANTQSYALRKNGSSEDIYQRLDAHPMAMVEADGSQLIEGKISSASVDFWLVGYFTAEAAGTVVTPSIATLITSTFSSVLALAVIPPVSALTLTPFAPSVVIGTVVTPAVGSLATTSFAPVLAERTIPSTAALTTSTFAPTLAETTIPATAALTLSVFAPTLALTVGPPAASLAISTFAPTVVTSDNIAVVPVTATLTTGTFAPVLAETTSPGTISLTLSAFAPSAIVGNSQVLTPGTLSLSTATFAPTISVSENVSIVPETLSLATTSYSPGLALAVIPSTLSLTTTGFVPAVNVGNAITVTPGTLTLTTAAFAPTISTTDNVSITPGVGSLTITLFAPVNAFAIIPNALTLATSSFAPIVSVSNNVTVVPGSQALVTVTFAPIVNAAGNFTFVPGTLSLTVTTYSPAALVFTGVGSALRTVIAASESRVTIAEGERISIVEDDARITNA